MRILNFLKTNYGIILVLALSFWAIKPLFIQGFFPMHDDTQVARVFEMGKMLANGTFPVRWVPDLGYGYGYPIFNFYAPLAYYVGGAFMLLGFDALLATKIMMALGVILAGVFMYLLAREFFGRLGGIVSGLFYTYAPYHALDIYVRGDVAEFWAYAFIPLAFLGLYKRSLIVGSLGFAGVILSHNLTALMVAPFLLIAGLLLIIFSKKETRIHNTLYIILYTFLGLALSAFYWIPALLEMKYTNVLSQIGGGADFRDHFVCLSQLWSSQWGFGGSAKGCIDGLSFMIGKLHILMTGLVLVLFLFGRLKQHKGIILFSLISFPSSLFLMLETSKSVWEVIPAMAFFQYPWRFLILASFSSSLLAGSLVVLSSSLKIKPYWLAFPLIALLLFFNIKFFVPQTTFSATSKDFTNEKALKWTDSKTSDEFLPADFKKPKSEHEVSKKPLPFTETNIEKTSNLISLIGALALVAFGIIEVWKNHRIKR